MIRTLALKAPFICVMILAVCAALGSQAKAAPVEVDRLEPWYGAPWPEGSTHVSPGIEAFLHDPTGTGFDEVHLLIDGEYWASWVLGIGNADYVRGDGVATTEFVDGDLALVSLAYQHSSYPGDLLGPKAHSLGIRFKTNSGDWFELDAEAPYAAFQVGTFAGSILD